MKAQISKSLQLSGLVTFLVLVLAGGFASDVLANSGSVKGVVLDDFGSPLPGVLVTAQRPGEESRTTRTDSKGAYRITHLASGIWELTFELEGFASTMRTIRTKAGRLYNLEVTLSLVELTEELIVVGQDSNGKWGKLRKRSWRPNGIDPAAWFRTDFDTETYDPIEENRFVDPHDAPLSTFAIDVDSASFANVRRFLNQGQRPPRDAVRVEEWINYFPNAYAYEDPEGEGIALQTDVASAPWNRQHHLVRIGLRTRDLDRRERPAANLVFLLDVSGSMGDPQKLPWVVESMKMLVDELEPRDRIGIVVYAGASGVVLPATQASDREEIFEALSRLEAGGSTNGGEGIEAAYAMAQSHFIEGGINRVILATDGDWNIGTTGLGDLVRLVRDRAKKRITLTCLGFGMGNLKDDLLESLSNQGDGNYAYIDSLREARKVLVEQLVGTLATVARDVKIQVEFNPARVAQYRLIGYENRRIESEDFEDDSKDGGEIGAGFSVTALYEVIPTEVVGRTARSPRQRLRYQEPAKLRAAASEAELMTVSLRHQPPEGGRSQLQQVAVPDPGAEPSEIAPDFAFAAALAAFAMVLQDSPYGGTADLQLVEELLAVASDGLAGPTAEVMTLLDQARDLGPWREVASENGGETRLTRR